MSAVILAVIVVMWAVVLVPMWLRRHDAATETRSVDRFSAAMRVLSRRQSSSGSGSARYVLMPRRDAGASVHVSGASARRGSTRATSASAASAASGPVASVRTPRRKASLAVRRRRVLLGLLAVALLTMVLAIAGVIGWVLQLVVDLIAVAFVVHLRTQAKRSAAMARQRRRPPLPADAVPVDAAPVTPTAARYAARLARPAPVAESAQWERAPELAPEPSYEPVPSEVTAESAASAEQVAVYETEAEAVSVEATGTDDAAWEPVPVPRPTYTMKPPAPPRHYAPVHPDSDDVAVDGSADDASGDEGLGDETVAPRAEVEDDGQLDEILTHRWAVND